MFALFCAGFVFLVFPCLLFCLPQHFVFLPQRFFVVRLPLRSLVFVCRPLLCKTGRKNTPPKRPPKQHHKHRRSGGGNMKKGCPKINFLNNRLTNFLRKSPRRDAISKVRLGTLPGQDFRQNHEGRRDFGGSPWKLSSAKFPQKSQTKSSDFGGSSMSHGWPNFRANYR